MTPRLPPRRQAPPQREEGTWIALAFSLGIVGGFAALISMILPEFGRLFLVLGGFAGFVALHYFTWGRWMIQMRREALEMEDTDGSNDVPPDRASSRYD